MREFRDRDLSDSTTHLYSLISRKRVASEARPSARVQDLYSASASRYEPKIEFQVSFRFAMDLGCGLNPDGIIDCRREAAGYVNVIFKQVATSPRAQRERGLDNEGENAQETLAGS